MDYLNRFEITFNTQQLLNTDDITSNTDLQVYFSNKKRRIIIHNTGNKQIKSVELYNILGQSAIKFNTNSNENYIEHNTKVLNAGVYLIKVKTDHESISKKVLVK